jgi:hypothetical protein
MRSEAGEHSRAREATQEMAISVGNALMMWQNVELALYRLFMILATTPTANRIAIPNAIYHAAVHLNSKMNLIDALVNLRLQKESVAKWNTLHNTLKRRAKIRDKLVHWNVISFWSANGFERVLLSPPVTDNRTFAGRSVKAPVGSMTAGDLGDHSKSFAELVGEVDQFADLVSRQSLPDI